MRQSLLRKVKRRLSHILEDMTMKQVLMVLEVVAAVIAIYEKVTASGSEKA